MTEKEISRKQRWRLGIIRHAEEISISGEKLSIGSYSFQ
jgi:hypothetical protein